MEMDFLSPEWIEEHKEGIIHLGDMLEKYIAMEKAFIPTEKYKDVIKAFVTAQEICKENDINECNVKLEHDVLQSGWLVIKITGYAIQTTSNQIEKFKSIFTNCSLFEVYALPDGRIQFDIMFKGALKRL